MDNAPKCERVKEPESADEKITELTELSVKQEKTQASARAQERREGEMRVCEAEIKLGSAAAKFRLDKIKKTERMTRQIFR